MNLKLFIIRHGQSLNNALAEQYLVTNQDWNTYFTNRSPDPPLTDLGVRQAEALARYLVEAQRQTAHLREEQGLNADRYAFTRIYCSPMLRAMQTAQPIREALGITPQVWIEIHEHGGLFEQQTGIDNEETILNCPGLGRAEILTQFPDYVLPKAITDKGWWTQGREEITACYARAIAVARNLRQMAEESEDERIALISHGTFIDALLKALLNQLPGDHFHYNFYNTAITRVDLYGDNYISLRYTNRVNHLAREMLTR
jgi:2,3-bisphosphoglycerate-dependent phosphoglycerate mutase